MKKQFLQVMVTLLVVISLLIFTTGVMAAQTDSSMNMNMNSQAETTPAPTADISGTPGNQPNSMPLTGMNLPSLNTGSSNTMATMNGMNMGMGMMNNGMNKMNGMNNMSNMPSMSNMSGMSNMPNGTGTDALTSQIITQLQTSNAMLLQMVTLVSNQSNGNLQTQLQPIYQMINSQTALIQMLNSNMSNGTMNMNSNNMNSSNSGQMNMGGMSMMM